MYDCSKSNVNKDIRCALQTYKYINNIEPHLSKMASFGYGCDFSVTPEDMSVARGQSMARDWATQFKHSMTTEIWISSRGQISEATCIALQEALEEDEKKDTPSFGKEDLEEIHRSSTEAGLLGIYNFPGSVYATDGSNDKGVMGAGFFKLNEKRGGCCQLGRGEEGNSSNRAELG